jgi:hypothetical protein
MEARSMRRLIFMGLIGLFTGLAGCSEKPASKPVTTGVAPLKPPNCPHLPELKNVTKRDGSIVDVRILSDGKILYYVPFGWYQWESPADPRFEFKSYMSTDFQPEISDVECAGVVHFAKQIGMITPSFLFQNRPPPPNFSTASKIHEIGYYKPPDNQMASVRGDDIDHGRADRARVEIGGGYWASYLFYPVKTPEWAKKDESTSFYDWDERIKPKILRMPEWAAAKRSATELFDWLKTPPRDRDNGRIFALGAEMP